MATKPLGKMLTVNFLSRWIKMKAPECTNNLNLTKNRICRHYVPLGVVKGSTQPSLCVILARKNKIKPESNKESRSNY